MQRSSVSPQGLTNVLDLEELFTNTQNFIASQERIAGNGDDEHVCRGKGRSCFPVDLVISPPSILKNRRTSGGQHPPRNTPNDASVAVGSSQRVRFSTEFIYGTAAPADTRENISPPASNIIVEDRAERAQETPRAPEEEGWDGEDAEVERLLEWKAHKNRTDEQKRKTGKKVEGAKSPIKDEMQWQQDCCLESELRSAREGHKKLWRAMHTWNRGPLARYGWPSVSVPEVLDSPVTDLYRKR
jgi:hypothetical protein